MKKLALFVALVLTLCALSACSAKKKASAAKPLRAKPPS